MYSQLNALCATFVRIIDAWITKAIFFNVNQREGKRVRQREGKDGEREGEREREVKRGGEKGEDLNVTQL